MDWYTTLVLVHLLALVFWLGTDIGVFVVGKFAQNPIYSVEQRMLLMKAGMIIDIFPRICMVISFPTGFQLAVMLGAIPYNAAFSAILWIFSGLWLAIVLLGIFRQGSALGEQSKKLEKLIHYVLVPTLLAVSIWSLMETGPISIYWVAVKVLVYALIIVMVLLLEGAFIPAVLGFAELAEKGSSPEVEAQITSGMDQTYIWVLMIYLWVFICAVLGIFKPW